jgi:hypothetical protein
MPIVLPPILQTPSPNVSCRNNQRIRLIVVHDTEGGYEGAVSWFAQTRSQVSAHLVMREDGAEVTQMAPLNLKAWHACAFNSASIGIEGAGVAASGFGEAWWQGMANIVAWLLHRYGVACRWARGGEGDGFCSHHDLGAAGGGHTDPCAVDAADWARFIALVEVAYGKFSDAPLPEWALHGLPAPGTVRLPPPALASANSHGGAPGVAGDDMPPPVAGAPHPIGSVADLQQRLNVAGAAPPLEVDGFVGPATRAALQRFQRDDGLTPDGTVGPQTWAALERATA